MRRLVTLFVLSLVGAGFAAVNLGGDAVASGSNRVSRAEFAQELSALEATPAGCYVGLADNIPVTIGAGTNTVSRAAVTGWANYRLAGTALVSYVESHNKHGFNAANLAAGKSRLLTTWEAAAGTSCVTSPSAAFSALPSRMQRDLIKAEVASMIVMANIGGTVGTTNKDLQAFYLAHLDQYAKTCASVALVLPSRLSAFEADLQAGATVAQLATKYSSDPSATKGGAVGCFSPKDGNVSYFASLPLHAYGAPRTIVIYGTTYYLFGAATSRTPLAFSDVSSLVLRDVMTYNAGLASGVKDEIMLKQGVSVDPALGVFARVSSSFAIVAPGSPGKASTPNLAANLG